jgi:uncharacterized membrane protein
MPTLRPSRWYAIPVRVLLVTFIGTLISFAVSLLLGILVTVVVSYLRHVNPNMTLAYRQIALPAAAVAGIIIFVLALTMEIRHYRQAKTLAGIESMN